MNLLYIRISVAWVISHHSVRLSVIRRIPASSYMYWDNLADMDFEGFQENATLDHEFGSYLKDNTSKTSKPFFEYGIGYDEDVFHEVRCGSAKQPPTSITVGSRIPTCNSRRIQLPDMSVRLPASSPLRYLRSSQEAIKKDPPAEFVNETPTCSFFSVFR